MKKRVLTYVIAWALLLALFNVIAFVPPIGWDGQEKYTSSFFIGYIFITLAFLGQLACTLWSFKSDSATKLFYKLSLIKVSYTGLIASFIFGGLCMLISPIPYWIGIVLCVLVLVATIIAVLKTSAVIDEVERVDTNVAAKTAVMKSLTATAQVLVGRAGSQAAKVECQKVYEAIRYSDPVSNEALARIEQTIASQLEALGQALDADDIELICATAQELHALIGERNAMCKLFKKG